MAVANYIEANSLGTKGQNLFIGFVPDAAGVVVGLTEYDGNIIETQGQALAVKQPSLQVMVSGEKFDYVNPKTRIEAIQTLLANLNDSTLSGIHFLSIRPNGTINALGQNDNQSFEFTANFEVTIV